MGLSIIKGSFMKKLKVVISLLILISLISAKDVLVKGTVKSFATEEPIANAAVSAMGVNMNMAAFPTALDTFFTDETGYFEKTIQVEDSDNILFYGAQKDGYLIKTNMELFIFGGIPAEVNIGDVLLKTIADATDTLEVAGSVIDSLTKEPLVGANVMISSGVVGDITIDSFSTDNDGNFAGKMPYIPGENALFNFAFYGVSKDQYEAKGDTTAISSDGAINLGEVELVPVNTPIVNIIKNIVNIKPTHFKVYSLQGKEIYSGSMSSFAKLNKKDFSNQQFVIKYFKEKSLVSVEKVLKK